jgi:hypothetical protein
MREKSNVPDPKRLGTDPDGSAEPFHCITDRIILFPSVAFKMPKDLGILKDFCRVNFLATYNYIGL